MQLILNFIKEYNEAVVLASLGLNTLFIILLLINYGSISSLKSKYKRLTKGSSGKNMEHIIVEHINKLEDVQQMLGDTNNRIEMLDNKIKACVQKVGFIRYNAFKDTGSDLSYSIALLNENDDGVIITGIHGRAESVSYAKSVSKGKSKYSLSVEELQALERAKSNAIDEDKKVVWAASSK